MPSTQVVAKTLLLGQTGLVRSQAASPRITAAGIDRKGRLSFSEIDLVPVRRSDFAIAICSASALGVFAPATRLLLADGSSISASSILEQNDSSGLRFETIGLQTAKWDRAFWPAVISDLKERSPFAGSAGIGRRCSFAAAFKARVPGVQIKEIAGQKFAVIDPQSLPEDDASVFGPMMELLFASEAPGVLEFEPSDDLLVTLYLSLCGADNSRLQCDSLQHSATIRIVRGEVLTGPYAQLRSVFRLRDRLDLYELKWNDASWKPIASGFLLSPYHTNDA